MTKENKTVGLLRDDSSDLPGGGVPGGKRPVSEPQGQWHRGMRARGASEGHTLCLQEVWGVGRCWVLFGQHFFFFKGPHLRHIVVPRLGVESELQPPAYTTATATAMQDLSCICDLYHSTWQHWILNPLSEARD